MGKRFAELEPQPPASAYSVAKNCCPFGRRQPCGSLPGWMSGPGPPPPVGTARPGLPPTLDVGLQLLSPRSHRPDQMPRAAWPRPVPSWDRAHPAVDLRSAQR